MIKMIIKQHIILLHWETVNVFADNILIFNLETLLSLNFNFFISLVIGKNDQNSPKHLTSLEVDIRAKSNKF